MKHDKKFKVSKSGSLIVGSRLRHPGDEVSQSEVAPVMLHDHVRSGLLIPVEVKEVETAPDAEAIKQAAPAIPTGMAPTIHGSSQGDEKVAELARTANEEAPPEKPGVKSSQGIQQSIEPAKPKDEPKHTPTWNLPRHKLEPKSLPELNAMILERDPEVPPFDDKNEAIAFLSQDWEEPKQ